MNFPEPDWTKQYASLEKLYEDLSLPYIPRDKIEGWHQDGADTMLVLHRAGRRVQVFVWNNHDPRAELKEVLGLPTRSRFDRRGL